MSWASVLAVLGAALRAAPVVEPFLKDLEDLVAAFRGKPNPTASAAVQQALEPQVAQATQDATTALETKI